MLSWRPVVGYEGIYSVSSVGDVRRDAGGAGARAGHILSQSMLRDGYWRVNLSVGGEAHAFRVHRLVALAFLGPNPEGQVVCHANDVRTDNRVENLRWDSESENQYDRTRNGNRSLTCKRGHLLAENIRIRPCDGVRRCSACVSILNRINYARRNQK